MPMTWYAIHDTATGELKSTGTVVASDEELAVRGLKKTAIAGRPDFGTQEWNKSALTFRPIGWDKPKAHIACKHGDGTVDTVFTAGETVTIEVEIRKPDDSVRLTTFNGTFVTLFKGPSRRLPIKLVFVNGLATKAVTLSEPGDYSIGAWASTLAHIEPFSITVTL